MKAYANNEGKLMTVSLVVTALGIIAILSSPFVFNMPVVFYTCVVLTIIAGLYLSRNLSYTREDNASPRKRKQRNRKRK